MSQPPAPPPRRHVPKPFRRQNSFAGFPSTALTIFNNNNNNFNINNNNDGRSSNKVANTVPVSTAIGSSNPTTTALVVAGPAAPPVYQPPPAGSRPPTGFYSLPRHNRPGHLSRTLGVGFHLLSRAPSSGINPGPSAAEQLGINAPSLPKAHRRNLSEGNTGESSKVLQISLGSLPRNKSSPKESSPIVSGEPKLKSSGSKKGGKDGESKSRRRDPDYQSLPRRSQKDLPSKRSPKETESKSQSSSKKYDIEPKYKSLPRRHDGEAKYQLANTKHETDPKYQSLPRRHTGCGKCPTFPRKRNDDSSNVTRTEKKPEVIPVPQLPSSPKRQDGDTSHPPSSPKKRTTDRNVLSSPKKREVGQSPPKAFEKPLVPHLSSSPKRRHSESKYQSLVLKQYDIDPKYQELPIKKPEVDPKYQTVPQKRHEHESKYQSIPLNQSIPLKQYGADLKYQAVPQRRYELFDPKYHAVPTQRYFVDSKYQTVPQKRHDPEPRYHSVPTSVPDTNLKYPPIPAPRYDITPQYRTIPPRRHESDTRYQPPQPPKTDNYPKFQPVPLKRNGEPNYHQFTSRAQEPDPKYQQLPPKRIEPDPKFHHYPQRPNGEPNYASVPTRPHEIDPKRQHQHPHPHTHTHTHPHPHPHPHQHPHQQHPHQQHPHQQHPHQQHPHQQHPHQQHPHQQHPHQQHPHQQHPHQQHQHSHPHPHQHPHQHPHAIPHVHAHPHVHTHSHGPPEYEAKYQQLPPRPDIEPKYQQILQRPDIEPNFQHLPRRPDIEPSYQPIPRRNDVEPAYQLLSGRPDIEPKYQQLPRRPDVEPNIQKMPPIRSDIELKPHYTPPKPDIEPKYQHIPLRKPDGESKYQQLPPRKVEGESKYDPKYQPLPQRRPDGEPSYQQLLPRKPDIEPKYQQLPTYRPNGDPKYPQFPLRMQEESKYSQLAPRDFDPKYQQLPPRRVEGEAKSQPLPLRRPDDETKYPQLPPRNDFDPKYQQLPPRRPEGDPRYHQLPPLRLEGEHKCQHILQKTGGYDPKFKQPLPQRVDPEPKIQHLPPRNEFDPKYQELPPRKPDGQGTYQQVLPKRHEYEFLPIMTVRPDDEHKHLLLSTVGFDYEFEPIPIIKPNYDLSYQSRKPDGDSHPKPPVTSSGQNHSAQMKDQQITSKAQVNAALLQAIKAPTPPEEEELYQPIPSQPITLYQPIASQPIPPIPVTVVSQPDVPPSVPLTTSSVSMPLHVSVQSKPLGSVPLYETLSPKTQDDMPVYETIPPKVQTTLPLYESLVPKAPNNTPLYETLTPKIINTEPQPAVPKTPDADVSTTVSEPHYHSLAPKINEPEPQYQSSPDAREEDPVYQAVTPQMIQDVKENYRLLQQRKAVQEAKALAALTEPKRIKGDKYHSPTKRTFRERDSELKYSPTCRTFRERDSESKRSPTYRTFREREEAKNSPTCRTFRDRDDEVKHSPTKRTFRERDGDSKHSPTCRTFREKDLEVKHSPTKRLFKERDGDSKHQNFPKKPPKSEPKYQQLPKRREKEAESKYQSSSQRSLASRRDTAPPPNFRWPPVDDNDGIYSSLEYPSEGRSDGPSEDEIYSSLGTTDDPVYQSVGESSYSRPQPPLPAPSRYRRRVDDPPPPLPPPRLTTGPVGPHNPLVSPSSGVAPSVLGPCGPRPPVPGQREPYPVGSSTSPSPENLLMQSAPPWPHRQNPFPDNDEVYSSIPSFLSSSPEVPPATLPRAAQTGRVAPSASWNSLGSSSRSSWDSLGSSVRSDGTSNARQRRRRARSDPRMDAGVLHRLAFTVWHTALHIEKENNNEAAMTQRQPMISSRNTQSEARLNRVMAGSMGLGGAGGGANGGGPKMDVVYVTEKIISLAFPPNLDDATYTLHLREVAHMLSSKHGDNFKVFNLSQHGEISHFLPRVLELGWADHLAPALERLCSICKALDSWITQHPQHVAVLHARGGYEKLGVVIAAYMHYSNICASTDQALDRYAMKRFFDDKIGQLYHPSQKRYVQYFAGLLSGVIRINSSPLYLHTLTLYGIPHFEPTGGCHLFVKIYQGMTPIFTSGIYNLTETMRQVTIVFETVVQLRGDILLKAYSRRLLPASREVIFRVQFHTCAVSEKYLSFTRHDLDDACNDMRFPLDGSVELFFTHSPDERPQTVSNVSCDKSPCAIASWNSYENISLSYSQFEEQGVSGVSHTLGPLDGSLYATVTKKRPSQQQQQHQQHQLHQQQHAPLPHSPVSPNAPSAALTPSPHGLVNGRYAASIDSGIASSNSAGAAPVSPPTSDTSRASGDSRGTAAAVAEGRMGGGVAPPLVDARQLDELLQGMLLDIQSIPDLRPCQTPAPDIDSIRCPDFNMAPKTESRPSVTGRTSLEMISTTTIPHYVPPPPPLSPVNGYSGSTTHDSLLDSSLSTTAEDLPYHARTDSKPFSYGAVTSSPLLSRHRTTSEPAEVIHPPASPSIHRRNSRETLGQHRVGLESPSLVRRMSGSIGGSPEERGTSATTRRSPSPSPSPEPGSRGGTLQRQRSHTLTSRIMASEGTPTSTLTRSEHTRSASRLDDSLDFSFDPHSRSFSSSGSNNLSWLQMQQRKLAERREAKVRAERGPQEARMLSELRTRMNQQQRTTTPSSRDEDGYVSDTTLLSETSRESSPVKTLAPLTINTGVTSSSSMPQKPPIGHSTPARGNSAPSSPILPTRSASRERTVRYNPPPSNQRSLPRKHSDTSHDRERPFVAVKRAHENAKPSEPGDSSSALSQLQTSPHGHINYTSYASSSTTDGLLTTVISSSNQEGLDSLDALSATLASLGSPTHPLTSTTSPPNPLSSTTTTTTTITTTAVTSTAESRHSLTAQTPQSRDDSAWQSDTESSFGGTRPITPGFPPATPTTPYLNQGLPPKSPTMQRRAHLGLSSLSSRPTIKKSASLPSKEMGVRSPSPATSQTLRQELNGHSSPAPSLYHGQSRRSSLTSLNESSEVISSHPKFVKDISKFWYKPAITRDEAINMLKDKAPGTFVVRDSNSFPGAFGLALKVSTPPPNVTSKSSDPASELVRHFLIEPTSRGVRLKGCANEPVFGSLSALVYQHSITALALPCRLMLPEKDPAGVADTVDSGVNSSSSGSNTTQLLMQGAACNVLYLHTADTESLTGPQAVKRAVSVMLAAKVTPTVVHFKVSAQGITLTDNERKLFFRRHYPVHTISHCGLDPDDRRWPHKNEEGAPLGSLRVFGFVAKKGASRTENQCHILAELEPEQPATAICNFVTKVMMTSVSRPNLV